MNTNCPPRRVARHEIQCNLLATATRALHQQPLLSPSASYKCCDAWTRSCICGSASILKSLEDKLLARRGFLYPSRAAQTEPTGDGLEDASQHLAFMKVVDASIETRIYLVR